MPKVSAGVLQELQGTLGLKRARIYQLIEAKVRVTLLPRYLAALVLAQEHGVDISRFADKRELAVIKRAEKRATRAPHKAPSPRSRDTVVVVHGRDLEARDSLVALLQAMHLRVVEWRHASHMTGEARPEIETILETIFRKAAAVVVLLTPDDHARLDAELIRTGDPHWENELVGQPRPNVLFRAGMAWGRNSRKTILLQLGDVRPFSGVAARHVLRLDNDPRSRWALAKRLTAAGCRVETDGADWLAAGDFPPPSRKLTRAAAEA